MNPGRAMLLLLAWLEALLAAEAPLQRLPAIVFDGRVVVYGVTDLEQALAYYRRLKAGAP